jgi:UDP-N-acetylmuramate--alanine ligase
MQPHRYTRLASLFDGFCSCFNDADTVIVAPVYAAGETPIQGFDRDALVQGLRARGHRHVMPLAAPEALAETVASVTGPGDVVICLGAGNITQWAYALPRELEALAGSATLAGSASPAGSAARDKKVGEAADAVR